MTKRALLLVVAAVAALVSGCEAGRECDFDFTVADQTFRHPNTGFRCCYY